MICRNWNDKNNNAWHLYSVYNNRVAYYTTQHEGKSIQYRVQSAICFCTGLYSYTVWKQQSWFLYHENFAGPRLGRSPKEKHGIWKSTNAATFDDTSIIIAVFVSFPMMASRDTWNKNLPGRSSLLLVNEPKQNSFLWCTSKGSFTNFLFHESKALMIFLNCEGLRWKCTFKLKKYISYLIRTFNPYVPKKDRKINFYLQDRLIFKTKM